MDEATFKEWLSEYGRVWESGDKTPIKRLYSPDARYYETPFSEPMIGLEQIAAYAGAASNAQRNIRFRYEVYGVIGDIGLARWGASFERVPSGVHVELDGVFAIRLDDSSRCVELREWWHRAES